VILNSTEENQWLEVMHGKCGVFFYICIIQRLACRAISASAELIVCYLVGMTQSWRLHCTHVILFSVKIEQKSFYIKKSSVSRIVVAINGHNSDTGHMQAQSRASDLGFIQSGI